jgi:Leucine rich repeat
VEEFVLANNRLVKIEGLSRLANLRVLKLARNSISRLENLDALVHLKYCDLSHNNIKVCKCFVMRDLLESKIYNVRHHLSIPPCSNKNKLFS